MSASSESFQAPPPPLQATPRAPRPTQLRPFGIAIFVLGLLLVGAAAAKVLAFSTGIVVALGGIIVFVFSFIPLPVISDAEPPLSFFAKVTGIFFEPSRVFRNLRVHPHWVGAYVIVVVLSLIYTFVFVQRITPERIADHMTEKISEMGALAPPPDRIEAIREAQLTQLKKPAERAGTAAKSAVGLFVIGAITAALCLLGILAFGGRINYWQALSVVFFSWLPITVIQKVLGLAIMFLKTPEDLHPIRNQETTLQDNLGLLMSATDHPVLFVLLSFIGLTWFYLIWLRAKGLNLGGTKVGSGAAWGVSIMIYILLLLFAVISTSLFPGFVS
ncbi:MAG TPA: YIP1 family protein [Pyrinomonadaceae bacterium]|jgi:hypothetical protein|nr:YIP1 family protein [Pyrinomonadaceae bacterium]